MSKAIRGAMPSEAAEVGGPMLGEVVGKMVESVAN